MQAFFRFGVVKSLVEQIFPRVAGVGSHFQLARKEIIQFFPVGHAAAHGDVRYFVRIVEMFLVKAERLAHVRYQIVGQAGYGRQVVGMLAVVDEAVLYFKAFGPSMIYFEMLFNGGSNQFSGKIQGRAELDALVVVNNQAGTRCSEIENGARFSV